MNQTTLLQGEPWMTPDERELNRNFVQSTTQLLAARGVPETPLVMLRVNDVIATWLLARRLERALTPKPGEQPLCPTHAQAGAIGKCRDRLRRAMKEFEVACPRDVNPVSPGLFVILQPPADPTPSDGSDHNTQTPAPIQATHTPKANSDRSSTAPSPHKPSQPTTAALPATARRQPPRTPAFPVGPTAAQGPGPKAEAWLPAYET